MAARLPRPRPPRPDLVRRPEGAFGWLDARLLHEGRLARLGPDAVTLLVLLALAADRRGASFYGRGRMTQMLGLTRGALDAALDLLRAEGLVVHRPWRPGHLDGVWQLLPVPGGPPRPRERPTGARPRADATLRRGPGRSTHIADILAQLGIAPDRQNPAEPERR